MPTRTTDVAVRTNRTGLSVTGARPTARQVVGGVGALGALLLGLVGIPLVLSSVVGWPLPHHIPTGAQVTSALGSPIPDSFWPRLFATLAWVAWAYFLFSVITSLVAQLRGHRPRHRRLLVGSNATAALVAAVLLLGQLRGGASPVPSARPGSRPIPAPVVQLVADTMSVGSSTLSAALAAPTPSAAAPVTLTHTVVEGDTLWSIAVEYYSDGEQWQTIYRANVGVAQPGGGALSDAHWIYPGWLLTIPAATQVPPSAPAAPMAQPSLPVPSSPTRPGLAPSSGASDLPSHGAVHPGSDGGSDTATHGGAPETDRPGKDRQPSATRSAPVGSTTTAGRAPSSRPPLRVHHSGNTTSHGAARSTRNAKVRPPQPHAGSDVGPLAVGAGLFGLAAIGLIAALDRRRRRQLGRRALGSHIPRPAAGSHLADLELQLRHYARAQHAFWVCHLPELLGHAVVATHSAPDVMGVELVDDGLDVLMAQPPDEPAAPFSARPDRSDVWHLPLTTDPAVVDEAAASHPTPLVLATVGRTATGAVLVNVLRYRSLHVAVPADQVEGILTALVTELAATTAPAGTAVVAVGFGYGVVDRLGGGAVVDELDDAIALLRADEPTVLLVDPLATTDPTLDVIRSSGNVRLVTAGPVAPAGTELVLDPEHPSLEGYGLEPIRSSHVSDDSLEDVQTLFELAEEVPGASTDGAGEAGEPDGRVNDASGVVVIGILGEPTIQVGDGDPDDLVTAVSPTAGTKSRRVAELLVYLAAHGGSATRGQWLTDISPDKALSDGYVRNLVLLTRRSLEALAGSSDLLAYDRATQRFSLAERITTDWKEFQSASADGGPAGLRAALGLVRGAPFGVDPDPWTSAGGLIYVMGEAITDAALILAEMALGDDDRRLAAWATRQGQRINRYDQGLWRLLLRSAADEAARQQIWSELHALLAVDGDPADDLEPATLELYDSLSTARRPASEVVVLQDEDDAVLPTRQAV